ncbi:MAG: hypothetical protein EOP11_04840 [Proteobacteria bacterium]|nr:MAG: hypothetical protein EOP11_04840 [Pseudomonadota bacterium]
MKLIFSVFLSLIPAVSFASGCEAFLGNYEGVFTDSYRSEYSEIRIAELTSREDGVRVFFRQGEGFEGYSVTYLTDGNAHPGDGKYTGAEYVATCDATSFVITSRFAELNSPLGFRFSLQGNQLGLTESLGSYSRETGRLLRAR